MSLTVRLNPKTERLLNALAKRRSLSRSDIVREALTQYAATETADTESGPYEGWHDVIGVVNLGVRQAGRTTGDQFSALLRKTARARRSR